MRGRVNVLVAALGVVVLLASGARAVVDPPVPDVVGVTEGLVYRWNLNTAGTAYVRIAEHNSFGDATRLNDGRYVAYRTIYQAATPALYEIDPATGDSHVLVASAAGAGEVVAMAPMRNGNLLGRDNTLGWVSINPTTLAYSVIPIVASNTTGPIYTGGMATSPTTGDIYAWCNGFAGSSVFSKLFLIDPAAGTATAIGGYDGLPGNQGINAMSFTPDGRLFGFTEINAGAGGGPLQPNSIYQFNLQTGTPTFLGQRTELADVRGLVFLPEPATPALIALAIAAIGSRSRGHRRGPVREA